jgi:hypothetical protein
MDRQALVFVLLCIIVLLGVFAGYASLTP